jgi:hypothetical protein
LASKRTELTTLPASPPAMNANPRNRNSLAFQTTLLSLLENALLSPSPRRCALFTRLTTSSPIIEQMPGIQSAKLTWITVSYGASGGGLVCAERIAASRKVQLAIANLSNQDEIFDLFIS